MRYSAEGATYSEALALIDELKKANIEANITAGGVSISVEDSQIDIAASLCKKHGASFKIGLTTHQNDIHRQAEAKRGK